MIKHRFLFEGTSIRNRRPVVLTYPNKDNAAPSTMMCSGAEFYAIPGSTWRGIARRAAMFHHFDRVRRGDPSFKLTTEDYRLFAIGGVRGNEEAPQPSPPVVAQVRERFPLLALFGTNLPFFMSGAVGMGIMTSEEPVIERPGRRYETLSIIRRNMISDHNLDSEVVSDWDRAAADQHANRVRSQADRMAKELQRKNIDRGKKLEAASKQFGRSFETVEEFSQFVSDLKATMMDAGQSTVSEANLQEMGMIPAGTAMRHSIDLGQVNGLSSLAIGMFLSGLHNFFKFNAVVGGLSARGCGGYLDATYDVRRFNPETQEFESDCTVKLTPYEGLNIITNARSALMDCMKEWKDADITTLPMSYNVLRETISARGA